jgi:hypothetical protein
MEACYCPFLDGFNYWDYLIILDACRYDYFASLHNFFLSGRLERVWSCSSNTYEFCTKCLSHNKDHNIVYISANPYINSYRCIGGCCAKLYVSRIVDAWLRAWSPSLGTVPPDRLTHLSIDIIKNQKNKKIVIHYIQPHAPYLAPSIKIVGYPNPVHSPLFGSQKMEHYIKILNIEKYVLTLLDMLQRIGLRGVFYSYLKVRGVLGLPPLNPIDDFIRKYGIEKLAKAYALNLLLVLANVAILVDRIKKLNPDAKIVITADHGECLGERGLLEHPPIVTACLREVPLFIVESANVKLASRYALRWKIMAIKTGTFGKKKGALIESGYV